MKSARYVWRDVAGGVRHFVKQLLFRRHHAQTPAHLLPTRFTIPELQRLHETILDRPLDARNFVRRQMKVDN